MEAEHQKYRFLYVCLFLAVAVLIVYWPVHNYDFVRFDDNKYVTSNRNVTSGITPHNVRWAFTSGYASNWHPVTWLSHMLDCQVFGLHAGEQHTVNLLFHIVNTLLLFLVLARMTKMFWASAFVAAVFGLHPLHVESVAWIAERKDVLSTFFWMLTMLAYALYAEKPGILRYIVTLSLFAIGLMAKPMLVTLPFVLLLLDYWPLERMNLRAAPRSENMHQATIIRKPLSNLVLEKIPFFVLAVLSSIVTFIVQSRTGAVQSVDVIGIRSRIGNAIVSYMAYIYKTFWPNKLAVLYPHPGSSLPLSRIVICALLLVSITIAVIALSRRRKYLVTGWFWYIGTLVPVIGIIQVGVQAMADRYTYIPMTGLLIIVAWGVSDILASWKYSKKVLVTSSALVLIALSMKAAVQLEYWQDSETLFKHTLDVTSDNYVMENNYAAFLAEQGKAEQAIEHLEKSIEIKPNSAEAHNNLANALNKLGKTEQAIEHYKKSLSLKPNSSDAHYNLAVALSKLNRTDEAISEYYEAIRLDPSNADALSNLGFELSGKGKYSEAVELYRKALALEPDNIIYHGRFGLALAGLQKNDEAIKEFQFVLKATPKDAEMWCNLGIVLERQNKTSDAIKQYLKALEIEPQNEKAAILLRAAMKKEQD